MPFSGAYTSLPVLLTESKLTALYVLSHVGGMENRIMSTNTINQEKNVNNASFIVFPFNLAVFYNILIDVFKIKSSKNRKQKRNTS